MGDDEKNFARAPWLLKQGYKYLAIPIGGILVLLISWPLILWVELIVARNNIESETDMVAVWLFVAQVATMLIPDPCDVVECCKD